MKELKNRSIPYKIYLSEDEMPRYWYNVRADMKNKPAPLLNPGTLKPMTAEEMGHVFCAELVKQEMDNDTALIPIPEDVRNFYKMYRPSPLVRAYCLEDKLGTPAHIYYKFEGNNTSGSHKLNSAIAQAYYAKEQGLTGVTTETGAGQWGTALSMACAYLGLDCHVFMVKCSYEQKPFRREVMRTYGAAVTPSPSDTTAVGRKILAEHPGTTGSLGCAKSNDVVAMVRKYSAVGRIAFMHIRNVKILEDGSFEERAHLSSCGSLDMYEIVKALVETGFDGYVRPDHGRMIWGETGKPGYGLYDRALGAAYINGLFEACEKANR